LNLKDAVVVASVLHDLDFLDVEPLGDPEDASVGEASPMSIVAEQDKLERPDRYGVARRFEKRGGRGVGDKTAMASRSYW
jgi:hypothetical protein